MQRVDEGGPPALTFAMLQLVNEQRCVSPTGFNHTLSSWSELEWAGSMAGEAGEACNVAKKIIRIRDNVRGNYKPGDTTYEELADKLAKECADTIIYAVLTLSRIDRVAGEEVRKRFNDKSEEIGYAGKV